MSKTDSSPPSQNLEHFGYPGIWTLCCRFRATIYDGDQAVGTYGFDFAYKEQLVRWIHHRIGELTGVGCFNPRFWEPTVLIESPDGYCWFGWSKKKRRFEEL